MADFSGAAWHKSRRSTDNSACVEIARSGDAVGVRDSKDPSGPVLVFTHPEFSVFLDALARGEYTDQH
jgi:hypothetical protein